MLGWPLLHYKSESDGNHICYRMKSTRGSVGGTTGCDPDRSKGAFYYGGGVLLCRVMLRRISVRVTGNV